MKLVGEDHVTAILLALEGLPVRPEEIKRPFVNKARAPRRPLQAS